MFLLEAALQTRRAFGFLFISVSVAVGAAAVISEIAYINDLSLYYYPAIWLGSFGAVFGAGSRTFRRVGPAIRGRMKGSISWPAWAKVLNAVCWAGPFASIAVFPELYQYLILLGIGLGNLSTYLMVRKYSGNDNREQLIVSVVSLAAIPAAFALYGSLAANQSVAVMLSRILIAVAYGAGGAYALRK